MSYADNRCPCGSTRKQPDTLLCADCVAHVAGTTEWRAYTMASVSDSYRRTAGIRLLAAARRRTTHPRAISPSP